MIVGLGALGLGVIAWLLSLRRVQKLNAARPSRHRARCGCPTCKAGRSVAVRAILEDDVHIFTCSACRDGSSEWAQRLGEGWHDGLST